MSKQATYYHNPRCSKSRKGLELVKKHGFPCIVKEYLKKEMTVDEVSHLIKNLSTSDVSLMVRKKDAAYKELNIDEKSMNNQKWAKLIADNPSILERPLLATNKVTLIGRPPENFLQIITNS